MSENNEFIAEVNAAREQMRQDNATREALKLEEIKSGLMDIEEEQYPKIPKPIFIDLYLPVLFGLTHKPAVVEVLKSRGLNVPTLVNWNEFTGKANIPVWVTDPTTGQNLIKIPPVVESPFYDIFSNVEYGSTRVDICQTLLQVNKNFENLANSDPRNATRMFHEDLQQLTAATIVGFKNFEFKPTDEHNAVFNYFRKEIEELIQLQADNKEGAVSQTSTKPKADGDIFSDFVLDD